MSKWLKLLLSDSAQASVRRFIGLLSFIELLVITNVALFTKVALLNVTLIIVAFNIGGINYDCFKIKTKIYNSI